MQRFFSQLLCTHILLVLYRRALAREGVSFDTESSLSQEQRKLHLVQAMEDLRRSIATLEKTQQDERNKMNSDCRKALIRLEKSYTQLQIAEADDEMKVDQKVLNGTPPQQPNNSQERNRLVNVAEQKQDIMRLLFARQMAKASPKGEAFFLIDWKWWCRWCEHVDFFYLDGQNSEKSEERTARVLNLLPPGAVLPNNDGSDSDSDDDTSQESSSQPQQYLGEIDNSQLLIESSTFHQQWYDTSPHTLRPNLIRGYHYELLPREVYNALRAWYGEVTPSLCRRTTEERVVVLYDKKSASMQDSKNTPRCCACRARFATARCTRCMSVQYCNRTCQEAHWPAHKRICKTLNKGNQSENTAALSRQDGRVGLNNLGNTCFMNSALQCLSHATPLTRHFLSNKFRSDINGDNPLGTGGKLALAYDDAMKDVWMKSKGTAISPTALKRAIALFAPRFAGCLQHDAQEFLAYLLDGLHEDLNRIVKAPYVEMPDVTDGHNMAIAGARAWDAHKRRNESLVMDTFYGQFQSTCVCPKCQRVSVSFDAFNHVSLEIPQMDKMTVVIPVFVFRQGGSSVPYRYGITLPRQSFVADLRRTLAEMTGIPPDRLILCDIYDNTVYELLNDKKHISTIRPNDVIGAYENEPYGSKSIHVIATHSLRMKDQSGKEQLAGFGFPVVTSFSEDLKVSEIWEHAWQHVDHIVSQDGSSDGYVDVNKTVRREDIFKIRLVDGHRKPVEVFQTPDGSLSSFLPRESSETLLHHLGKDCAESFVFFSLEWENMKVSAEKQLIDPQEFAVYNDHKSLIDAVKLQRSKSGAKGVTLDECFQTFTKPERLDEHNMWYCSNCKEHVRALKTMKLWRLPNILVVHLKRFEFKHALRRDKLDTFVDFPLENLDMNPHCANWKAPHEMVDDAVPAKYDLFGVINHFGRLGFGHYTAFARQWDESAISQDWALFDDSSVRETEKSAVVTPAAYVLFYRRRTFN